MGVKPVAGCADSKVEAMFLVESGNNCPLKCCGTYFTRDVSSRTAVSVEFFTTNSASEAQEFNFNRELYARWNLRARKMAAAPGTATARRAKEN